MQNTIRHLLDELYELEPNLRDKEKEIVHIIEKMSIHKPQITIDEAFKKTLRKEIMHTFVKTPKKVKKLDFSLRHWLFPLVSVACALLVFSVISPSFFSLDDGKKTNTPLSRLSFSRTIEDVGYRSFDTDNLSIENTRGGSMEVRSIQSDLPIASPAPVESPSAKMMAVSSDMVAPPYEMTHIVYTYSGTLDIPPGDMKVYEKGQTPFSTSEFESFIENMSFDGFDIHALKNTKITSLTLVEDRLFGYMLSADLLGGTLSLYQNYDKWPQIRCNANGCESLTPIKESDIPTDGEMTRVADEFIRNYGISRDNYGDPRVDHAWKSWITSSTSPESQLFPESITITYPYLLDDKLIYEENGSPRGLSLTYDLRSKGISSAYGISKESLKSSLYPVTQDKEKLQKLITQGGRHGGNGRDTGDGIKTITVALQAPEVAYMRISKSSSDGKWREYYVPALIFHVGEKPEGVYAPDTLTIPLIDEFMERDTTGGVMPYTEPAMMMR